MRGWLGALWPDRAGILLLRGLGHLVIGYGYVALLHWVLGRLQASGILPPPAAEPS